jgi:hypothetical protein
LTQHVAHPTRIPLTPDVERVVEMLVTKVNEMAEKPRKLIVWLILIVSLFRFDDVLQAKSAGFQTSQSCRSPSEGLQRAASGSER